MWSLIGYRANFTFVADSTSNNCLYELENYLEQLRKKLHTCCIWFSCEILEDYSYSKFNYGTQQKSRLPFSTGPLHLSYRLTSFKVKKHLNALLSSFAYA